MLNDSIWIETNRHWLLQSGTCCTKQLYNFRNKTVRDVLVPGPHSHILMTWFSWVWNFGPKWLFGSMIGINRLCSATFEQLKGFWATFCSGSNLEQLLPSFRARGGGEAGWASAPAPPSPTFGNFEELLRKRCFQPPPPPPHFESLFSSPTFKAAPRALSLATFEQQIGIELIQTIKKVFI